MNKKEIELKTEEAVRRLAAEIRDFLARKGINEGDYADSLDIGRSTFSNFLTGKSRYPSIDVLLKPILLSEFRPWFMEKGNSETGINPRNIAEAAFQVDQVTKLMPQPPEALERAQMVADLSALLAEDDRTGTREKGQKFWREAKAEAQASPVSAPALPRKRPGSPSGQKGSS
jgi:hypothetical protein